MITILSKYRLKADEDQADEVDFWSYEAPEHYMTYDDIYFARKDMRKVINKALFPKASISPKENKNNLISWLRMKPVMEPGFDFAAAQAFVLKSPSPALAEALEGTPFVDGMLSYGLSMKLEFDEIDWDKAKVSVSLFMSTGKKFSGYEPQPTASKFIVESSETVDSVREAFDRVGTAIMKPLYQQVITLLKKPNYLRLTPTGIREIPTRIPEATRLQVKQTKDNEFTIKGVFVRSYSIEVHGLQRIRETLPYKPNDPRFTNPFSSRS